MHTAAGDPETLVRCPQHETEGVCAVAVIMLLTAFYQFSLFTVVGMRLFATPGEIDFIIPVVASFIAIFIMKIDAYTIMRSGWHLSGIAELKRGGLDISGGLIARVKAAILLGTRILLAFGLAQLMAIFVCMLVFEHDIDARIDSDNIRANAPIVAAATDRVDGDIRRQHDAIAAENVTISTAVAEASALRKRENDLTSSEPQLQGAQAEVAQLASAKTKIDDEVQEAETFALNEAAGIKIAPTNSGQIGEGIRYRAASERVANAKARAAQIAAALDAARGRLDDLTKRFTAQKDVARQQIEEQLELTCKIDRGRQGAASGARKAVTQLTAGRNEAIQADKVQAPDYVPKRTGLLIQIAALRSLADGNPEIAIVILLIEIVSFGFELAGVLAKITAFVPTTYAAYLARDAYMRAVAIVDEMAQELDKRAAGPQRSVAGLTLGIDIANDNQPQSHASKSTPITNGAGDDPPPQPPKRPRGRPRKTPVA